MSGGDALVIFALAVASGAAATAGSIRLAPRLRLVAAPNPVIPQHTRPVPEVGGIGVIAGMNLVIAATALLRWAGSDAIAPVTLSPALVAGVTLFFLIGVVDDRVEFAAWLKFLLQVAGASVAVGLGLRLDFPGLPAAVDAMGSAFVVVSVVNAVNLTDVCDGLVGGLLCLGLLLLGGLHAGDLSLGLVGAGAVAGFLVFNRPPARVFLGDSGSSVLGFLAASLVIGGADGNGPWVGLISGLLVLGVPLFELVFLPVMRARNGRAWWRASSDHFSLRLQAAGLSKWQTDGLALGATALLGAEAFAFRSSTDILRLALLLASLALAAVAWRHLVRWEAVDSRPE